MNARPIGVIGAGPIGLELAVACKRLGLEMLHFEAGQIGQTMSWYPRQMQFFSAPDRIAIGGVPLLTVDQTKATREEYLTYLRAVVEQFDLPIHTYERVEEIGVSPDGFTLHTKSVVGWHTYQVSKLILATGDLHVPRRLGIPGEDLAHVSHYFDEPHPYFRRQLMVVGGRNSAVEAALRCSRAGAQVSISYRGAAFPADAIKYWLLPDVKHQIRTGQIAFYPETVPSRIEPGYVTLEGIHTSGQQRMRADFVLILTGYEMDRRLFTHLGIALEGESQAPRLNPDTMETHIPGLFVAGTAVAGTQRDFRLFIENCHPHVGRIIRAITGREPPFPTDDTSRSARHLPES